MTYHCGQPVLLVYLAVQGELGHLVPRVCRFRGAKKALSEWARRKLKNAKARAKKQKLGASNNQDIQAILIRGNFD
jgi:hypothetical protein